ncbi:MAG: hypothetical protein M1830_002038 [Pleopsidium flavum]|nr:MAG: hypothetical protein M1830_008147 [Pleopsidium flavum]KAI9878059.1 MAG: hypothetical protein M1830_002038 [Pleopsidium flavum]
MAIYGAPLNGGNDARLRDEKVMKWVDKTGSVRFGHAQFHPKRPTIADLLGVHKWMWESGDNVQLNNSHDVGGIKFRLDHGRRVESANVCGDFRYTPRTPPNNGPAVTRYWVTGLRRGGPNYWFVDMARGPAKITGQLYWTRQPGDEVIDSMTGISPAGHHPRFLCLRYPDPNNPARPIELFGAPQLGRKRDGIDGPTGYPSAEDYPANDDFGVELGDMQEFGLGVAQGVPDWEHWLIKKGYQMGIWKLGLLVGGQDPGVELMD